MGIRAAIYEGLAYGSGDAVIGINPVDDAYDSVARLLDMTYDVIRTWHIPTPQNCVLAHVTTQMQCLRSGTPVGLVFQSLAGSQQANDAFGISVGLLDDAYALAQQSCFPMARTSCTLKPGRAQPCRPPPITAGTNSRSKPVPMASPNAYQPFQVNTVVGFIGPEYLYDAQQIQRAGLEDHFMGKLTGLPMGVDACYTNHARADQNAIENLAVLLTAAGVTTSWACPWATMPCSRTNARAITTPPRCVNSSALRPAPEFEAWLTDLGLMQHGVLTAKAGDPTFFLQR